MTNVGHGAFSSTRSAIERWPCMPNLPITSKRAPISPASPAISSAAFPARTWTRVRQGAAIRNILECVDDRRFQPLSLVLEVGHAAVDDAQDVNVR